MTARTFRYEAIDGSGSRVKGRIEADSADAAAARLSAQGRTATRIDATGSGLQREIHLVPGGGKPSHRELTLFVRQFATLLGSGVPLVRSLAVLAEQAERPALARAIDGLRQEVVAGRALSQALAAQGATFPPILQHMVRAGETAGFLDQALARSATVLESEQRLRSQIRGAMVYPAVVLGIMAIIATIMLVFVVPIFEQMFADLGGELPLPTQILVTLSANIWWILPLVLALVIVAVVLFRRAKKVPAQRRRIDALALKLPVFGQLNRKVAMSRFARNLSMLLGAGVPVLEALEVAEATVGNQRVADVIALVQQGVRDGQPLSAPLAMHPAIFPPMVVQMLQVGEDSGQVEAMLDKVAQFYDEEVETTTRSLTSLLEPLLIVVLGVVVGAMVLALYLPMFSIYDQIA